LRHWLALTLLVGSLAVGGASAAPKKSGDAGPELADTWYAASLARGAGQFLVTHYWSKGSLLRSETVAAGRRLITIVDATTYYIIDPTTPDAIAIARSPLSMAGDAKRKRPFADELSALIRGGGERVDQDEVSGMTVDRYQLTNEAGRVQVWARTDLDLPVRVDRYIRASSDREQIDYINWLRGLPIDDGFFAPPAGLEIARYGYEEYITKTMTVRLGPAPPFYAHLLHGEPND